MVEDSDECVFNSRIAEYENVILSVCFICKFLLVFWDPGLVMISWNLFLFE